MCSKLRHGGGAGRRRRVADTHRREGKVQLHFICVSIRSLLPHERVKHIYICDIFA